MTMKLIITLSAATILFGSTLVASAQSQANPYYWGGGGFRGPGTPNTPGITCGSTYNFAPQ
jgi:hypothetical protein